MKETGPWNITEILTYAMHCKSNYKPLEDHYKELGLKHTDPESRMDYLSRSILKLEEAELKSIVRYAEARSKPSALRLLEFRVADGHKHGEIFFPKKPDQN